MAGEKRILAWLQEELDDDRESDNLFSDSDSDYNPNEEVSDDDHLSITSEHSDTIEEDETEDASLIPQHEAYYTAKNQYIWKKFPPHSSKTRASNIIKTTTNKVVLPPQKTVDSFRDSFELFITSSILSDIVKFTNQEAQRVYTNENKKAIWKPCDEVEIRALIGLLITAGHLKSNHQTVVALWNPKYGPPISRATMSKERFKELLVFIRFDDKSTRSERREKDKLAPIRDVWEAVCKNLTKHYLPGSNITVDEQLVPFRGRCPFRQYMASKPDKYGMKIFWVTDSRTFYPLKGIPYLGKEGTTKATNLGSTVVLHLTEPYNHSNRNVTCDNFFTSLDLGNQLLSNGLTMVGTLRKNKPFIPPEFQPNRTRENESSLFGFTNNFTLVSYVPSKSKAVLLLSSMHHTNDTIVEEANKPDIILYYNETKSGVDTLDQMVHAYSCKRKTNRWPAAFFMNLIDVCGVAAYVVWITLHPEWKETRKKTRRRLFLVELAESLIIPQIERRPRRGLHHATVAAIEVMIPGPGPVPVEASTSVPTEPPKKRRCFLCDVKKGRMQRQVCDKCKKNVCSDHSVCHRECVKCKKQ